MVHAGNLVRATDTTPIVIINQISPIYVSFAIPEAMLPDLKRYMAQGTLRGRRARRPTTTATPVDRRDHLHRQRGRSDHRHDQDQGHVPERRPPPVARPVRQRHVTLATEPNAIVVPSPAVQTGQQGTYVFVVKPDKTVELRAVTVERTSRRPVGRSRTG